MEEEKKMKTLRGPANEILRLGKKDKIMTGLATIEESKTINLTSPSIGFASNKGQSPKYGLTTIDPSDFAVSVSSVSNQNAKKIKVINVLEKNTGA